MNKERNNENDGKNYFIYCSSAATLNFILGLNEDKDSDFYKKIDTENIGVAGHSQGGVGAINAVTEQSNGNMYKASTIKYGKIP